MPGESEQARHSENDLGKRLEQERERAQQYSRLSAQQTLHERDANAAEERYRHIKQRIEEIGGLRIELQKATENLLRLEEEAPAQARAVQQHQELADQAKSAVEQVRSRRGEVHNARRLAELAARFCRAK
ncbi:MAG: hypothetical protein JJ992_16890, partial [Planctomycetes bacterium]|nr:hypothetical protein [Planctomycetota bacterium]